MKKLILILFISAISSITAQSLNVQGVLRDADNKAVADGDYTMVLNLYDSETAASPVFSETYTAAIVNGVYNLDLGSQKSTEFRALDFSKPYWLGIEIDGSEVSARSKLSMSPYLFSPTSSTNLYPSSGEVKLAGQLTLGNQIAGIPDSWYLENALGNIPFETGTNTQMGKFTFISPGQRGGSDITALVSTNGFYLFDEQNGGLLTEQLMHVDNYGKLSLRHGFGHVPRGVLDINTYGDNYAVWFSDQLEISQPKAFSPAAIFGFNAHLSTESPSSFWFQANDPTLSGALMFNDNGGDIKFRGIDYTTKSDPSGHQNFSTEFNNTFVLTHDGKLGIGTHEPDGNLDVRGKVRVLDFRNEGWSWNVPSEQQAMKDGLIFESDGFLVIWADHDDRYGLAVYMRYNDTWERMAGMESNFGQQTTTIPVIANTRYIFQVFNAPSHLEARYIRMGR